jgi:hypothetical protein
MTLPRAQEIIDSAGKYPTPFLPNNDRTQRRLFIPLFVLASDVHCEVVSEVVTFVNLVRDV